MWTLAEQHDVDGPIVHGYLRLHRSTPERHAALAVTLAQYCKQHELQLRAVFAERGEPSANDPAFLELLDVLTLSRAYGVVLPTADHLGGKPLATRRKQRLDTAGARLLLVRGHRRVVTAFGSQHRQAGVVTANPHLSAMVGAFRPSKGMA